VSYIELYRATTPDCIQMAEYKPAAIGLGPVVG
jgi:hypothetical protein